MTLDSNSAGSAGELDFSTFLSIMHQQLQQEAPEQEILQALLMADKEQSGYILVSELRAKLTALGEKLTDQEGGRCRRRPSCLLSVKHAAAFHASTKWQWRCPVHRFKYTLKIKSYFLKT